MADDQLEIRAGVWRAARAQNIDMTEAYACATLQQLGPLWDELFPAEQTRLMQLLVEQVDVQADGIEVRLRVDGLASLVREFGVDARVAA